MEFPHCAADEAKTVYMAAQKLHRRRRMKDERGHLMEAYYMLNIGNAYVQALWRAYCAKRGRNPKQLQGDVFRTQFELSLLNDAARAELLQMAAETAGKEKEGK